MRGKWLMICSEDYYNVGEVIEAVGDRAFLIRIEGTGTNPDWCRLYLVGELATSLVTVFDNRDKLDAYLDWLDTDTRPKLVQMKRR